MDTDRVDGDLPGSPLTPVYNTCGRTVQGMSIGWGDSYGYYLPDQWVVLDGALADGSYVLRSITDPLNLLYESSNRADAAVESRTANEAVTRFVVVSGAIQV
jgi:hypothetical protein